MRRIAVTTLDNRIAAASIDRAASGRIGTRATTGIVS
jgi:hypothetical protein